MMRRLENKVAIVTGASQGIGRSIAYRLAEEGAHVVFTYRSNEHGAQELIKEIQSKSGKAQAYYANFKDRESVIDFINKVIDQFGRIDILVNNAGKIEKTDFLSFSERDFVDSYKINVVLPLMLIQETSKSMINRDIRGSIINISSIRGHSVQPGRASYCCSKAALNMLTKCAAMELSTHGIRVNCIEPGLTKTGMNEVVAEKDPSGWEKRVQRIPLGRAGNPDDYGGMVAYFASDESQWVTGTIMNIDGGHDLVSF